jgi:hypothetical protein
MGEHSRNISALCKNMPKNCEGSLSSLVSGVWLWAAALTMAAIPEKRCEHFLLMPSWLPTKRLHMDGSFGIGVIITVSIGIGNRLSLMATCR